MSDALPSLTAKINELFSQVTNTDGRRLTNEEVAARARESGHRVSEAYVSQMRTGRSQNPSFQVVVGVAKAFGVPVAFFLDEQMTVEQAQHLYAATAAAGGGEPVITHTAGRHAAADPVSPVETVTDNERQFMEAALRLIRSAASDNDDDSRGGKGAAQ